jgi:pimeloyl-ACP methyl ester carboxylesterase
VATARQRAPHDNGLPRCQQHDCQSHHAVGNDDEAAPRRSDGERERTCGESDRDGREEGEIRATAGHPHTVVMRSLRSLLLVHGAGSGPWVFDGWRESFPSAGVVAVDLHAGLDVSRATMADYAAAVVAAAAGSERPLGLCGWSMGGLVTLQAAEQVPPHVVVLLEPSPPREAQGCDERVEPFDGLFDPERVYGPFPAGVRARMESTRARMERKRGISVPSLPCPSIVVYGDGFADERGPSIAALYGSRELYLPGLDHWGLVRDERVREQLAFILGA